MPKKTTAKPCVRSLKKCLPLWKNRTQNIILFFTEQRIKKFHDQLSLKVCEKLVPLVEKLLQQARQKGEIQFDDLQAAATFCVYGQLGILLADDLTQEDKSKRIREFLIFALHL